MGQQIHTFDVFDTCLVRTFHRPEDVFFDLAREMLTRVRGRDGFGTEEISELARGRQAAEAAAQAAVEGEARLDEIYQHFRELQGWEIDAGEMLEAEIELELRSIRPISSTKRVLERLRERGERIIFASDMYLPQPVVRRMLLEAGMAEESEPVYVSSEARVTKRTGGLFRLIMEQEGVGPSNMVHTGDSLLGDFVAARRLGIGARLFADSHRTRLENAIAASGPPWVSARIAGVSRATRLSHAPDVSAVIPGMEGIAANVVAPLLTGYVLWALREATGKGIGRLYFVARDGQILLRIASALAGHIETPELRYLYGSRQAWYLPSVQEPSPDDLSFAVLEGQSRAPDAMLRKLGITTDNLALELAAAGFGEADWGRELGHEEMDSFWEVLNSPRAASLILSEAERARTATIDYLRQEGLLDDDNWALVDVGWTLRTQASLKKILKAAGQSHVTGYYLGITRLRFPANEYGRAHGYLVEEVEDRLQPGAKGLFENKAFLDDILIQADHGPTLGYRRTGEGAVPRLGDGPGSPEQQAMLSLVQTTAAAFASELAKAGLLDEVEALQQAGRVATDLFFRQPTAADAKAMRWASLTPDPNQERSVPLVAKIGIVRLLRIAGDLRRRRRRRPSSVEDGKTVPPVLYKDAAWGFSWLEGSVAISGLPAKLALAAFRRMQRTSRNRRNLLDRVLRPLPRVLNGRRRR